jgi:hypothetical protein
MPDVHVVDPRTPAQLSPAAGLWVADAANLKGGGVGILQPIKAAWTRDAGTWKQIWPTPPKSADLKILPATSGDWRFRQLVIDAPGATSYSISAQVGTATPVVVLTGTNNQVTWDWFNAGGQFAPGATVTYTVHAINSSGEIVTTWGAALPTVPAPTALTVGAITTSSVALSWAPVPGATKYETLQGGVVKGSPVSPAGTVTGLSPSTTYSFTSRAICTPTGYVGAVPTTGPQSTAKTAKTAAPAETGPANGVYRIEPTANATWTVENGWRPTSDDLYHGTYSSTNGAQRAFFFFGSALAALFPDGLGTKTVTKFEVYIKRFSSGGSSAGQDCHWAMHKYTSKPSGTPAVFGSLDAGNLAWGDGEWITLSDTWGAYLVDHDVYKGFAWGGVAGRYMSCDSSLGLSTPNGTIRITIGN